MKRCICEAWKCLFVCAGLALATGVSFGQQDVLIPGGPVEFSVQPLDEPRADLLFAFVRSDEEAADDAKSEYWLGVQVSHVPEVAKQQLGIENGLVVREVVPDSPAAKADIRRHDILTKVKDTPLTELEDLVKAVEAADGKEMTITMLRQGKERSAKVTATKRPASERTEGRGVGLFFPRPGVVVPPGDVKRLWSAYVDEKHVKGEFPSDLSVRVTKEGDQPAKIHVKRGDQEWDVTEDKLDELPEDIRPHVQKYIGKGMALHFRAPAVTLKGDRTIRVTPEGKVEGEIHVRPFPPMAPAPPIAPAPPMPPRRTGEQGRVFSYRTDRGALQDDPKLEAILKEIRELRKEVDELRKSGKN